MLNLFHACVGRVSSSGLRAGLLMIDNDNGVSVVVASFDNSGFSLAISCQEMSGRAPDRCQRSSELTILTSLMALAVRTTAVERAEGIVRLRGHGNYFGDLANS